MIEILIVVAIMGLLISVIGPNLLAQFQNSKAKTAEIQIEELRAALDMFSMDVGRYPTDSEGLAALVDNSRHIPGWKGPYLRGGKLPADPWRRPFRYFVQKGEVHITSLGPEGVSGGSSANAEIAR